MTEKKTKPQYDWDLIEKEYRTGLKSNRQLGAEFGPSHTAIAKRAKEYSWTKDLSAKIQQAAADKVAKALVASEVAAATKKDDAALVEAVGQKVADVDLQGREDLRAVLNTQRTLAKELTLLSKPEFAADLVKLGELMDQSGPNENGTWVKDKLNELYQYIISLAGRVKMAKDIASAYSVYIPLQRKIFGLDAEKQQTSEIDDLLKRVHAERTGART